MFHSLVANVKKNINVQLRPMTAFCGPNRGYKTAHLDAVALALTGSFRGGSDARSSLLPEGQELLYAELVGDGARSYFALTDDPKVERSGRLDGLTDADVEKLLPLRLSEILTFGSTRGREALIKRFGQADAVKTPLGLSETQQKLWKEGLEATEGKPIAEQYAELSSWFRKEKLALGRQISPAEKALGERQAGLAGQANELLPKWQQQLEQAKAWARTATARQRRAAIEAEIESYRASAEPLREQERATQAALAALAQMQSALDEELATKANRLAVIEAEIEKGHSGLVGGEWLVKAMVDGKPCLLCGNEHFDAAATRPVVEDRVAKRKQMLDALYAERDALKGEIAVKRSDLDQRRRAVEADQQRNEDAKSRLRDTYTRIVAARAEIDAVLKEQPEEYDGPSIAELEALILRAQRAESDTRAFEAEASRIRDLRRRQEDAKTLEGVATKALNGLLAETAASAVAAVNLYMPQGFRADLDLEGARWMVVGKDGRGHTRHTAAGSEVGALLVALVLAWTEGAPARFLVLDDIDLAPFDPENLALLLARLYEAVEDGLVSQVFIGTSRPWELPDFVHKIVTDEGKSAALPREPEVPAPAPATPSGLPAGLLL